MQRRGKGGEVVLPAFRFAEVGGEEPAGVGMNQIIAAAVDDIDMRARLRTCRKLMQDRLHVDIDDRHAERLMIGRLDDGRDAQHRNAHGTPAPHTELNRRDINLSQRRRLRRFEKVDCARVLQLAVGDDTYRAVLAETVDPDQFAPVGEIDQAEDIVGRLGGKLGGETPGQAFPPRRLGDPTLPDRCRRQDARARCRQWPR
ncbi:MAG: hypothetical protein WBL55_19850, partial [Xanthobacteraceae bacterium]